MAFFRYWDSYFPTARKLFLKKEISCSVERLYFMKSEYLVEKVEVMIPKYVISMDTMNFSRNEIYHMNILDFLQGKPV